MFKIKKGDNLIIRLEKGEEIVESIINACEEEKIKTGIVSGIGACKEIETGYFNTKDKKYFSKKFTGHLEIVSLSGNFSHMNGEAYGHFHIAFSDEELNLHGGHLNSAIISATGEIFVQNIDVVIDRKFSEEIGLNLMDFRGEE